MDAADEWGVLQIEKHEQQMLALFEHDSRIGVQG